MPWKMFLCLFILTTSSIGCSTTPRTGLPAHVPNGYSLAYSQDFASSSAIDDFCFTDKQAWRHAKDEKGDGYLELFSKSDYQPTHRSPRNIALLRTGSVGSFVLDVDIQQTSREYGHRDACVFFGFKDPEHFYYTHMATKGDANAHQVFVVNDSPRTPVTTDRTKGVDWGIDVWRHIRVMRNVDTGTIAVYFDDMENPVQVARDAAFTDGYVGFGSFDDTGRIDNIRLYASSMSDQACKHYETTKTK